MPPITEFVPALVPHRIDASVAAFFTTYARVPLGEVGMESDLTWFATGLGNPFYNGIVGACLTTPTAVPRIQEMIAQFHRRQVPFSWHLGPTSQPLHLKAVLLSQGLHLVTDEPGMAVDLAELPALATEPVSGTLEMRPVTTPADIITWVTFWSEPNTPSSTVQMSIAAETGLGFGPECAVHHYVAFLNEQPCGRIALCYGAGVVAVHHLLTHPDVRQQGIGTAMTVQALHIARQRGYQMAVLFASPMAVSLYQRLGFREYCRIKTLEYPLA